MIQRHYQAQQVPALLKTMRSKQASGMLQLNAQINAETTRSRVFVWRNGEITYGGYSIPDKTLLIKKLVQQFKPSVSEVALKFALEKG